MQHHEGYHLFEALPLTAVALVLAIAIIIKHVVLFIYAKPSLAVLATSHRHELAGKVLLAVATVLWLLLLAPFAWCNWIELDLFEFNGVKPFLRLAFIFAAVVLALKPEHYLSVRAGSFLAVFAGLFLLKVCFLETWASWRVLIVLYAYAMIVTGLVIGSYPYLYRNAISWLESRIAIYKALLAIGAIYGLVIGVLALTAS